MHVARYNVGIQLDVACWRVSGFEVRHYALASNGGGIVLVGATNCAVANNHVHTIGSKCIFIRQPSTDNLVENNLCRDPRLSTWPWAASKSTEHEQQGISNYGSRGNVIRFNTVRGTFDGIDGGDETNENGAADFDLHDNLVTQTADDALEIELYDGINVRVWRNRVDNVFSGFSIAPIWVGPKYVLYNTITNTQRGGFKFSLSSTGQVFIVHNTVSATSGDPPAVHPSGPYSNIHFRNNILVGRGSAAVSDDAGEAQTGNDFDGDLIHSDYPALFRWKGVNYSTIAALRSATGFEINGRAGDPMFTSPAGGDYTLRAGSPAIDGALRLFGINDRYNGPAPDMGAHETGAGPDVTPPAAIRDLE
jgi:hypothetical protein